MKPRAVWPLFACAMVLLMPGSTRPQQPAAGGVDPFLAQYAATFRFTLGTPQAIKVPPGGGSVLFLRSASRSFVRDLYEVELPSGRERLLASAEHLLGGAQQQLSAEERARLERERITARGITGYDLSRDGARLLIPLSGRLFVVERATGEVRELPPGEGGHPLDPRFSPDGRHVACVRGGDLYVIELAGASRGAASSSGRSGAAERWRRLTTGATSSLSHGLAEFVAQEEMGRREGYWWSPDSRLLAYEEADTSKVEVLHIADPMHPEHAADSWPYPRPGKANAEVRLGIIPAKGGTTVWARWEREKFPYLAEVRWDKGGPLTLLVQNRQQTSERLLAVDPRSGATSTLLEENDPAWVDLYPWTPRWLEDGSGFLWISARGAEPRLELRGRDGAPLRWLTPEPFGLRSLAGVDEAGGQAYVVASTDSTQTQLWRVPLRGGPGDPGEQPVALTHAPGLHEATFARDAGASVWAETPLAGERSWSVRRRDGSEAARLRSVAEQPPFSPRLELATVGPLGFRAALIRPRSFEAGRKVPVLVRVYGGPTAQTVHSSPWEYMLDQWFADHGFVVVTLDGRGTPGRGRQWDHIIKGNLIDLQLDDQVTGLQALGARYPELDLSRVGIFGWSFGGYFSAMAAMRRPDIYKAGVAGAPVCDWQDYDTHYTERYLDLPQANPEGYRKSSVLTWCPELSVPLLIVHGTADDNVYMMHSLKMADALFRAGKKYDFLLLPGFTHMVPDAVVQTALQGRILSFFAANLHPQQP